MAALMRSLQLELCPARRLKEPVRCLTLNSDGWPLVAFMENKESR